jgi:uncharacterized protein (DUF433 family)
MSNGKIVNAPFPYIKGFTSVGLKELEPQLLAPNPSEKVQAIQLLAQSLGSNWKGIEKTPRVCGGEARIAKTRIPIWVLVEARHLGYSDAELLTSYPTITATDLANAWTYAEAHPDEIELAIERNEVA